jgi:hypothetical protein
VPVNVDALRAAVLEFTAEVGRRAGERITEDIKAVDVPVMSGRLQREGEFVDLGTSGEVWAGRVEFPTEYASFSEEGTQPHRIDGNPLLAFYWPKAGRVVVVRHVNHPGTRAQKWFAGGTTDSRWQTACETAAGAITVRA